MSLTVDVRAVCLGHKLSELQRVARELNVRGRSRMRKQQLIEALSELPEAGRLLEEREAATEDGKTSSAAPPPSTPPHPPLTGLRRAIASDGGPKTRASRQPISQLEGGGCSPSGTSRLGLVAVDPHRIHVFWDLDAKEMQRARKFLGARDLPVTLRLYPLSAASASASSKRLHFDIRLPDSRGSHYVRLSSPGHSVRCEAGFCHGSQFVAVAWSNLLTLPAGSASERFENRVGRVLDSALSSWAPRGRPRARAPQETVPVAEAALDSSGGPESQPGGERSAQWCAGREIAARAAPAVSEETVERTWRAGVSSLELAGTLASRAERSSLSRSGPSSSTHSSWTRAVGAAPAAESRTESFVPVPAEASLALSGLARPGTRVEVEGVSVPVGGDGAFEVCLQVSEIDLSGTLRLSAGEWCTDFGAAPR